MWLRNLFIIILKQTAFIPSHRKLGQMTVQDCIRPQYCKVVPNFFLQITCQPNRNHSTCTGCRSLRHSLINWCEPFSSSVRTDFLFVLFGAVHSNNIFLGKRNCHPKKTTSDSKDYSHTTQWEHLHVVRLPHALSLFLRETMDFPPSRYNRADTHAYK